MANLDEELNGYYEAQELDEALLDDLVAMESAAPKRRPWVKWVLLAGSGMGVAAAALIGLGTFTMMSGYERSMSQLQSSPAQPPFAPSLSVRPQVAPSLNPAPAPGVLIIQGNSRSVEAGESMGKRPPTNGRPRPRPVRPSPARPVPTPELPRGADLDRDNDAVAGLSVRDPSAVERLSEDARKAAAMAAAERAQAALQEARRENAVEDARRRAEEVARRRAEVEAHRAAAEAAAAAAEAVRREHLRVLQTHPDRTPTRTSATSTFAVDTDTASWSRSHAALMDGHLPRPDEVRSEEFINAFKYDYEPPSRGPFAVALDRVPSPFDTKAHLVRIGLQGEKVSVFDRKPVHLTFLVDVSGSMSAGDKLPLARRGMEMLVRELRDGDTVAITTYAGRSTILLEPTSVNDRESILRGIRSLSSGGGTSMGAGIDLAYGLAEQTLEPGAINRVVVLSDGDANIGERNATKLAQRLRDAADKGITLTTLGFGRSGYRDDMMEQLANKGDGQYHWIGSDKDAKRVLVDHLTGTLQTIARDVKIQVEFDPAVVRSWRLIGYENRRMANRDFRNDRVDAGEVGAGHQVTALYEVELIQSDAKLGELRLRYEAPGAEGSAAAERAFPLTGRSVATLSNAAPDTRVAVVAATFAERLRGRSGPSLATLLDLLPHRPEYDDRDGELVEALRQAQELGLK